MSDTKFKVVTDKRSYKFTDAVNGSKFWADHVSTVNLNNRSSFSLNSHDL